MKSMETLTFETKDLTLEFIADLKQRFTDSGFELKIFDKTKAKVSRKRMNETDYLLSTDANRKHLERAIENVNNGNAVTYDFDEFVKLKTQKIYITKYKPLNFNHIRNIRTYKIFGKFSYCDRDFEYY